MPVPHTTLSHPASHPALVGILGKAGRATDR
ncbi:hypothetical protein F4692_001346 [Nocardioides cavernae]|uniref:Uncharacterized protein n=1 Tax=Nocardioides cavernae TaxID=1921566 RepID=A0A7Y9H1J7_9ACTN|nr:hypothetical protein [Nocardioides cavernae]